MMILVLNATFSNISAILWRPVLVVEETRVTEENHRPLASNSISERTQDVHSFTKFNMKGKMMMDPNLSF
jgi:hypothetical protein